MVRTPQHAHDAARSRWYLHVVPVVALVLVVLGIALVVSSTVREQVGLSTSRKDAPYVELYFPAATSTKAPAGCVRDGRRVRVAFLVRSHLERSDGVDYRVGVDARGRRRPPARTVEGTVATRPGATASVTRTLRVPAGAAYVVTVDLPQLDQQLRASCPAAS